MPSTHSQTKLKRDPQAYNRIETEEEYELAIERIEELWDSADGTPEAQIRDVLVSFVEEYETRNEDLG
jgi:antitoxin component HigA of HigAB toxin-antitoxin module